MVSAFGSQGVLHALTYTIRAGELPDERLGRAYVL